MFFLSLKKLFKSVTFTKSSFDLVLLSITHLDSFVLRQRFVLQPVDFKLVKLDLKFQDIIFGYNVVRFLPVPTHYFSKLEITVFCEFDPLPGRFAIQHTPLLNFQNYCLSKRSYLFYFHP